MVWDEFRHEESGGLLYRYGHWTVQPHKGMFGYEEDNYLQWEILLLGKMFWNTRGQRKLMNKLQDAMSIVEQLQAEWEQRECLWISSTGALANEDRTISRIPYMDVERG
jgi:hypothetical protein